MMSHRTDETSLDVEYYEDFQVIDILHVLGHLLVNVRGTFV